MKKKLQSIGKNTISEPESTTGSSFHSHIPRIFRGSKDLIVFKEALHFVNFFALYNTFYFDLVERIELRRLFYSHSIFPRQHLCLIFLVSLLYVDREITFRPGHSL